MFIAFCYIISSAIILLGSIHYIQYTERSHMREWMRQHGLKIFNLLHTIKMYKILCSHILNPLLILSEMNTGILEGLINLPAMIELVRKENCETQTESESSVHNEIQLMEFKDNEVFDEGLKINNDVIYLNDNMNNKTQVTEQNNVFKTISKENSDNFEEDNMSYISNQIRDNKLDIEESSYLQESDMQSNKFIDSPTVIKKIIRKNSIKTNIKKDGNKIKVSITKKKQK